MIIHASRAFIKIFFISLLISPMLFAADFLRPKIKNYGHYMSVSESLKNTLHPLYGHVPNDVNRARVVAPMDGERLLKLSVVLPLNNEDDLDELILDNLDAHSAHHKKFLSHEEFVK
jgi:hypothetical protein